MWKLRTSLVIVFVIILTTVSFAGVTYIVVCEKCGFTGGAMFGGGFTCDMIMGYCAECEKFVYLSWTRKGKQVKSVTPPPTPLCKMWIPTTGETINLYACPNCSKPFTPIKELTRCPKCGESTLKKTREMRWD